MYTKISVSSASLIIIVLLASTLLFSVFATDKQPNYTYPICTAKKFQDPALTESIKRGAELYTDFCMMCHMTDGKGTPKVFPPLAGSDWLINKRKESIHAIKYGLNGAITVNGATYNSAMTSLGLEDEEIADILNYVMNSWGNTQDKMVTAKEVAAIKK